MIAKDKNTYYEYNIQRINDKNLETIIIIIVCV